MGAIRRADIVSRVIFWDTMLFIHLLDKKSAMTQEVRRVLQQSLERNDTLMTSCLAVGEVVAGAASVEKRALLEASVRSLGFRLLPFSDECISAFGKLRSQNVSVADSIHLACAAAASTDLFLTEDRALHKRHIEGIKFIAGIRSAFPQ